MYKLFTHTDLDGAGCAVLAKLYFNNDVNISYLNNIEVDDQLNAFINSGEYKKYLTVYITDISCSDEIAQKIEKLNKSENTQWVLKDHHKTALPLNKYSWVCIQPEYYPVNVEDPNIPTCGTSLFNDEFRDVSIACNNRVLQNFVECVRLWDTWQWQDNDLGIVSQKLSTLLKIVGIEKFVSSVAKNIETRNQFFDDVENTLVNLELDRKELYINQKINCVIPYEYEGNIFALVFASEFISELGNRINTLHPEYKGVIIVTEYGISFRTIHNDIDVSVIANNFGGGGHQKAAGISFTEDQKRLIVNNILK